MQMMESGEIKESERNRMIKQEVPRALDRSPESLSGGEDVYHKNINQILQHVHLGFHSDHTQNLSGHLVQSNNTYLHNVNV